MFQTGCAVYYQMNLLVVHGEKLYGSSQFSDEML